AAARRVSLSLDRLVSQDSCDARRAPVSQPAGTAGRATAALTAAPAPHAAVARRPPAEALALRRGLRAGADGLLRRRLDRRPAPDVLGGLGPPDARAPRAHARARPP